MIAEPKHSVGIEEMLRALAREDVRPRPAFKVQLTERLIAAMAARPRLLGWRPALAGVAILLLLAVVGWVLTPRVPQWATLIVENGEAQVSWQRPLYFRWSRTGATSVPAGLAFPLAAGDRVVLSEDGKGTVVFQDGSRLRLLGGTALTLEEIDPVRVAIRVEVTAGEAQAEVPALPAPLTFEVKTPAAAVVVRGTVFRTRVVAADHTYSATDKGTTQVTLLDPTRGYPSVEVPAGYEVDAIVGQPLQVRPQRPQIDHLTLDDTGVTPEGSMVSNHAEVGIFGKVVQGQGDAVLLLDGREVDRSPVSPEGRFHLRFRAPSEGTYALCIAIESPDGVRSPCFPLSYQYDITPPSLLRLLEPTVPEVVGETAVLRGETEPGTLVRLNGKPVPVDPAGGFAVQWALQPGENGMLLEACDRAGNCARLEFVLVRR
ncbi:MAG: FecR family protein [Anaerolineae bacterium]|jgi:hypothetical protein